MRIGLIADLAIGMDAGGSHAWSNQKDLLVSLKSARRRICSTPTGRTGG